MDGLILQFGGAAEPANPALGLLAGASLKAAVILAGALVATLALRRASAATRHLVWSAAIAAALLLPLAGAVLPAWRVPVPALPPVLAVAGDDGEAASSGAMADDVGSIVVGSRSALPRSAAADGAARAESGTALGSSGSDDRAAVAVGDANGSAGESAAGVDGTARADGRNAAWSAGDGGAATVVVGPARAAANGDRSAGIGEGSTSASNAERSASWPWGPIALLVWAAGAAVVAAGVLVGLLRVRRLARRARVVSDDRIASRVRELSARLGLDEAPRVLRGDEAAMPMTWGIARSVVFLPAEAEDWSEERLDSVLLHELAHVRRRDYLVQLAADAACAVYWFNPLAWLAARRLRVEREHACDDQVLFAGARPSTYAGELLELARSLRPARATAFAAMSMARPSQLTGRLLAVLDEGRPRRVVSRPLAASIALGAAVLLMPLAALTPAARGETPEAGVTDGAAAPVPDPQGAFAALPESASEVAPERAVDPPAEPRRADAETREAPASVDGESEARGTVAMQRTASEPDDAAGAEAGRGPEPVALSAAGAAPLPLPDDAGMPALASPPATSTPPDGLAGEGVAAATQQCWEGPLRNVSTRHSSNDDVWTLEWSTDDCEVEARIEGEVRFTGDFTAIRSISPGGLFRVDEEIGRTRRRLEVRPGSDGRLVYELWVDGDRRPFDAEARAWFGRILVAVLRRSTFAVEERVAWLLGDDGVDAVLAEVERIPTDHVQRHYLVELLRQADPDAAELVRIIGLAGVRLDSDFELAQLLTQVANEQPFTDELRRAFIEASHSLGSDFERARVLTAALQKGGLTEQNVVALIDATQEIGSDFEKARLLVSVGEMYALGPEVQRAYLRAARDIGSDFEQRRVLDALLAQNGLTTASVAGILDASRELGSDFELAQLLMKTARLDLGSTEVRRAYLTAAESIDSDFELKRVLLALIEENDLDDELLRSVIETAAGIDSDFELASLLVAIAGRYRIDGEVRETFLRAADTIDSGFEHGRVSSALLRQERGESR